MNTIQEVNSARAYFEGIFRLLLGRDFLVIMWLRGKLAQGLDCKGR